MALKSIQAEVWTADLWYRAFPESDLNFNNPHLGDSVEWLDETLAQHFYKVAGFSTWNEMADVYRFGTTFSSYDSVAAWNRLRKAIRIGFLGSVGEWTGSGDLLFLVECGNQELEGNGPYRPSACLARHIVLVAVRSGRIISTLIVASAALGDQRMMRDVSRTKSGWQARIEIVSVPTDLILPKKFLRQQYRLLANRNGQFILSGKCRSRATQDAPYLGW